MKTNLLDAGDGVLTQLQLLEWLSEQTKEWGLHIENLLIVPDQPHSPFRLFKAFCELWLDSAAQMDVLIALGTHPPMTEEAIEQRLEISRKERLTSYGKVRFFNHVWDDPTQLRTVGHLTGDVVSEITDGLFSLDVAVSISSRIFDYDQIVIMDA